MKRLIFSLCALLFLSCHPREGDYYENRGTKERVSILSVGSGHQLFPLASRICLSDNKITQETRGYDMSRVEYNADDSLTVCILFFSPDEMTKSAKGFGIVRYQIISRHDFLQDHSLVN